MNRYLSAIGAAAVALVMSVSSFGTATAGPIVNQPAQITSGVELVQHRDDRRHNARPDRRHHRADRAHRRDRPGYWNGHRGYREHRRGYRRHSDGYYYAPSVFRLMIR
ncbi:hypothetical protein [Rhizobium sp. SAFR-030]|uniref:hypothetical protein n=1 Tax=Rhizobium sp. SAFR-030 TaxID=3387277 RepID=UPI003F81865A